MPSLEVGPLVIDVAGLFSRERSTEKPSKELSIAIIEACKEWGFLQVTNHGFDQNLFDAMTEQMEAFFSLPLEEKLKVERSQDNSMGYSNNELTKQKLDLKELFDFCYVPHPELPANDPRNKTLDGTNRWPEKYPEFERVMRAYFEECTRCAFKLLEVFCIGLNLDPSSLHPLFEGGIGFMRLNYYPLQPQPPAAGGESGVLGIHPHTDAGFLTLLKQDHVPGLEVWNQGSWHPVKPIEGALTINVGDMFQVLSNNLVQAPLHRVRASLTQKRYSAPFFFNPAAGADIAPLPCFIADGEEPHYNPINWGEFRSKRFAGDYADVGEEVQICHYATSPAGLKAHEQKKAWEDKQL